MRGEVRRIEWSLGFKRRVLKTKDVLMNKPNAMHMNFFGYYVRTLAD